MIVEDQIRQSKSNIELTSFFLKLVVVRKEEGEEGFLMAKHEEPIRWERNCLLITYDFKV